ncbi:DUF4271 domain-containing protein [Olivibacter sp. SDN3]|uniref:DUF4271 domain-containing protein n=1 Tax=Olivibacter sp. SDN3 TaxID=2764720 RepID=UPI001651047F|nr:DUF4271 domain-containing protein [Olivibacter sp. SDN3]QNL50039.1 DUF4271 domain-containing protein [Olivibacter sp. SDN3]
MLKLRLLFSLLFSLILTSAYTQQDSAVKRDSAVPEQRKVSPAASLRYLVQDSARFARVLERQRVKDSLANVADSLKAIRDSLQFLYLKPLPPDSRNQFLDSLRKHYIIKHGDALTWGKDITFISSKSLGNPKVQRQPWVLMIIFLLLLFLALIRLFFMKDLHAIATSFYSNRVLLQISKEDNLITSWPFIFLYLLFGFTVGLFLYLYVNYSGVQTAYYNIALFFSLSLMVLVLFTFKILITRGIGFVFGIQRLVRDYISILYLSYFNAAIIFLPLILVLSLIPTYMVKYWLLISCVIVFLVFMMQFFRAFSTVLKSYQFSKFYLFIYLCTLEVGPILILIKVLGV